MQGANGFFPYDDILNEEQRNDIQDFFADTLNTERAEDFTQFILAEYIRRDLRFRVCKFCGRYFGIMEMCIRDSFYTVGKILGHSLKGVGIQLGISTNLEATTAQYVDVRLDRIRVVLQTYHNEILPEKQLDTKKERTHRKDKSVK